MEYQSEELAVLRLNVVALDALRVSAKWAYFLGIVGFIFIGLFVVLALVVGVSLSGFNQMGGSWMGSGLIAFFYILMAILYFFPTYYLFQYAVKMKNAFSIRNSDLMAESLVSLKSHHKFLGIMVIVMIVLYVLFAIGAVLVFANSGFNLGHN